MKNNLPLNNHLHIVSFDVPYPPDYGGVTDIFYKIKALHGCGIKIHLHCFNYGRGQKDELNKYCYEVIYYHRNTGWKGVSIKLPYIVNSRKNKKLIQNLLQDNFPVLLEGIHCTYYLFNEKLKNKKVVIRLQNVEFKYYAQLAKNERSVFKKWYFIYESFLLKKYEKKIAGKVLFIPLAENDLKYYEEIFNANRLKYVPPFISNTIIKSKSGIGDFCLYHGNLSVIENEKAAEWIITNIFCQLKIPLFIAGKNPSIHLINLVTKYKNVTLVADPSEEKMEKLILNAQINILPSFNETGIKIKLLNALFTGRFCVVNNAAVIGTLLKNYCYVAETAEEFIDVITELISKPFSTDEIEKRTDLLKHFDNERNAELLMQLIY